jgi:DNA-binding SARP family transcriptional activator
MPVELHLFGFPRLAINGRTASIGLNKALALLAYLAEVRSSVARETLAAVEPD